MASHFGAHRDGALGTTVNSAVDHTTNMPEPGSSDYVWYRITYLAGDLTVLCEDTATDVEPTWDGTTDKVYESSDFDAIGGYVGFARGSNIKVDHLTIRTDADNDGQLDDIVYVEEFDLSGDYADDEKLEHDAAGNLTYDGSLAYTYDAWGRQVETRKAYRDANGVQSPLIIQVDRYDALGRRIERQTDLQRDASGDPVVDVNGNYVPRSDLAMVAHFYHSGQRIIEVHNGSGQVIKQYV